MEKRRYLFDNLKAILIFFVVSSHFIRMTGNFYPDGINGFFYILAFSFIMQGFFFVSGYFSKNLEKCRKNACKNFLFPYFLWMPIMYFCRLLIFGEARFRIYLPTHALWFFLVMFVYKWSLKDLVRIPYIGILSILSYLFSGCIGCLHEILALGRIFSFLPFFLLGYYCQWEQIEKIRAIKKKYMVFLLCGLLVLLYYISSNDLFHVELWHLKNGFSTYEISNLKGIGIRLLIGIISCCWIMIFLNLLPDRKLFFSSIGQHTLTIFVGHIPIRYFIKWMGISASGELGSLIICLAISTAVVYFFSRDVVTRWYHIFVEGAYHGVCRIFLKKQS